MKSENRILAFAGSNSSTSLNKQLIDYTATLSDRIDVIDLRDYEAPIYGIDLEQSAGIPESIQKLHELIIGYDSIIMSVPEHNGLPPAFFKNILDWLSRIQTQKFLENRNVALLSTSPGGFGGANNIKNLSNIMPFWGANIVGTYSLAKFYEAWTEDKKELKSEEEQTKLKALLDNL